MVPRVNPGAEEIEGLRQRAPQHTARRAEKSEDLAARPQIEPLAVDAQEVINHAEGQVPDRVAIRGVDDGRL